MKKQETEFDNTVQFLFSQLPMFQKDGASAYKKDLSNTVKLCEFLGQPQHQFKSIHIAGTNGKGSSAHYLASIYQTAGYKTGLYTSPHLKSFTERIKINGIDIEKSAVVDFVSRIKPMIDEVKPSFFEITVAMCFDYFAKEQVDIAVIEVGMGGRLDSTNVILPEISLITNISPDHQQWLGDTLGEIAKEKAGIIKNNRPVVISERQPEIESVFIDVASEVKADIYFSTDSYQTIYKEGFEVMKNSETLLFADRATGPKYQTSNINGVIQVVELLNQKGFHVKTEQLKEGLEKAFTITGLKGRWQKLNDSPLTFCDVGHNESGIDFVLAQINSCDFEQLHFVLGVVADKDLEIILNKLPKSAYYYFCQASIPRAMDAEKLAFIATKKGLIGETIPDVNHAIQKATTIAGSHDFIFIGGSNFVVAEIENL